ncbi:MAG: radical SAM family heme chaperone HemW [Rikenellaceae bacterium]|nr:radical SAM family heme chaperone HemW [Rikenellaceae bacterium]
MAGLYIHIPFCRQICAYCDFYTTAAEGSRKKLLEALLLEMEMRGDYIRELDTIYIGGGTPSLFAPSEIQRLIDHARKIWRPAKLSEVTIEVNPEDVTEQYAAELAGSTDISRVSIGVQSFNDDILKAMRRNHDGAMAADAINRLRKAGILNLSVDFIYGIPGLQTTTLRADLRKALSMDVQHVSAYHLTIDQRSILANRVRRGLFTPVSDKTSDTHFQAVREVMTKAGFVHYEVSNFASNEWYCGVHNSNYWKRVPYLGLGPGAHSFDGYSLRHANIASLPLYLEQVGRGRHMSAERLTDGDKLNEFVMLSLRTMWGIDTAEMRRLFGKDCLARMLKGAEPFIKSKKMRFEGSKLYINPKYFLISDSIISSLFF